MTSSCNCFQYDLNRHMEDFFIISPLGLEKSVLKELNRKWKLYFDSDYEATIVDGGIELSAQLDHGLELNRILKTPTRILLRIKKQKCRDFPKLFKIIQKVNWKKFLKKEEVLWKITTKESRLINTTKIEKSCHDALKKYFNANRLPIKVLENAHNEPTQKLFLRVENDDLTLSIDTSGDSLHIRGNDSFRGLASIRSTLASVIIQETLSNLDEQITLVDPMCGSCTYLKESRDFFKINNKRTFAYESWSPKIELKETNIKFNIKEFKGFDIDKNIINKNKEFNLEVSDVFTKKHKLTNPVIICNPPYGKRVKIDIPRRQFFKELISSIEQNYNPKLISIIVPADIKIDKFYSRIKIFNSGIWVYNYLIK